MMIRFVLNAFTSKQPAGKAQLTARSSGLRCEVTCTLEATSSALQVEMWQTCIHERHCVMQLTQEHATLVAALVLIGWDC